MFVVVAIAFPVLLLLAVLGMERVEQRVNPPASESSHVAVAAVLPVDVET